MIATKRQIRTSQDRVGGFSTSLNEDIYASSLIEQPTMTDYDLVPEVGKEKIGDKLYEVEKEYKVQTPETISEETNKNFMPTVQRKSFAKVDNETTSSTKVKINTRGKILISVYSCIAAILIAFCIYNAFAISGLSKIVDNKQEIVATEQASVSQLEDQYEGLASEQNVRANLSSEFRQVTENDKVYVVSKSETEVPQYEEPTNFFNKICIFISNLFN